MADQTPTIDLSAGLTPKQPAQSTQPIDLSAGLVAKSSIPNPASEAQMFQANPAAQQAHEQTTQTPMQQNAGGEIAGPMTQAGSGYANDVAQRAANAAVGETKNLARGVASQAKAVISPPQDAKEHAIAAIGGPGALVAYRTGRGITDAAENLISSKREDFKQATRDFANALQEFHARNYRAGAADTASMVSDFGALQGNPLDTMGRTREISQGTKQGGDIVTPTVKDLVDLGAVAATEKAGDVAGEIPDAATHVYQNGKIIAKGVKEIPAKVVDAISDSDLIDRFRTRPETPAAQHGTPVRVESPLDGPTVGKQLGGKDLSSEAVDALKAHVGDKIPAGSSAKNVFMRAVEPISNAINDLVSKANKAALKAPDFTTSIAQDEAFGEGALTKDIDALKENLPASEKEKLSADADAVLEDADKIMNSHDASEILEYRRQLGQKIDWDAVEKNPSTPAEVQNAARVKVYRHITGKIHEEIPETVAIDKQLGPQLELRSHMRSKLGDRVADDPHAATAESNSEFKKGKQSVENAEHNSRAESYRKNLGIALGIGTTGVTLEAIKKLFGL